MSRSLNSPRATSQSAAAPYPSPQELHKLCWSGVQSQTPAPSPTRPDPDFSAIPPPLSAASSAPSCPPDSLATLSARPTRAKHCKTSASAPPSRTPPRRRDPAPPLKSAAGTDPSAAPAPSSSVAPHSAHPPDFPPPPPADNARPARNARAETPPFPLPRAPPRYRLPPSNSIDTLPTHARSPASARTDPPNVPAAP